jgi:hypothetical protein
LVREPVVTAGDNYALRAPVLPASARVLATAAPSITVITTMMPIGQFLLMECPARLLVEVIDVRDLVPAQPFIDRSGLLHAADIGMV